MEQGKQSYGEGRNPPPQVENVLNCPGEIGLRHQRQLQIGWTTAWRISEEYVREQNSKQSKTQVQIHLHSNTEKGQIKKICYRSPKSNDGSNVILLEQPISHRQEKAIVHD